MPGRARCIESIEFEMGVIQLLVGRDDVHHGETEEQLLRASVIADFEAIILTVNAAWAVLINPGVRIGIDPDLAGALANNT